MTDSPETPNPPPDTPSPDAPPEPKPPRRNRGDALKRLRKSAKRKVRDNSGQIAQKLLDLTLAGDMPSAKMLVSLIGKPSAKPAKKNSRPGRVGKTVAMNLLEEIEREREHQDEPGQPRPPAIQATGPV
jgi:hypothetical protein